MKKKINKMNMVLGVSLIIALTAFDFSNWTIVSVLSFAVLSIGAVALITHNLRQKGD